jgi:hypothetical protein
MTVRTVLTAFTFNLFCFMSNVKWLTVVGTTTGSHNVRVNDTDFTSVVDYYCIVRWSGKKVEIQVPKPVYDRANDILNGMGGQLAGTTLHAKLIQIPVTYDRTAYEQSEDPSDALGVVPVFSTGRVPVRVFYPHGEIQSVIEIASINEHGMAQVRSFETWGLLEAYYVGVPNPRDLHKPYTPAPGRHIGIIIVEHDGEWTGKVVTAGKIALIVPFQQEELRVS